MTYTTPAWATTSVARIKADYVLIYRNTDGTQRAIDANLVLTQMNDCGDRRTILGVVDITTGEVIAAPDVEGFEGLMSIDFWRARTVAIKLDPLKEQRA